MASIRRPHSPAKQHLLRHHHPFASSSPPPSPLRHPSSSPSSPRTHQHHLAAGYPHPFLFLSRRPLPRFAAFFLLGSFLGLLHFLSHLPHTPHIRPADSSPNPVASASDLRHQLPIWVQDDDAAADDGRKKLLIVVTPTRARAAQAYYLSRMGQTLRLVDPPLLWVVVQAGKPTPEAAAALRRTAVMHRYVGCCNRLNASSDDLRPHQMNAALELVENHRLDGIVYFAHEEGVYSLHLFQRLRRIRCAPPPPSIQLCVLQIPNHGMPLEIDLANHALHTFNSFFRMPKR